jgi:hypothetical protein
LCRTLSVYAIAALLVATSTVFHPALQAVITALLSKEERLAASSVAWSSGRLVQIVGASAMITRLTIPRPEGPTSSELLRDQEGSGPTRTTSLPMCLPRSNARRASGACVMPSTTALT